MCDFRLSHLKPALLVLASVLAPSALALTCYRCANLKVSSNPDTCVDRALWSEVNGTMGSKDRCRILKRGGKIVSMGVVTEGLCSNVSLKTIQNKMHMMYKGSGDKYAYCCNKNLCTEDPNPPKDPNLEVEFVGLNGIAGGNNKLNNNVKYDVKYTSGLEERKKSPLNEEGQSAQLEQEGGGGNGAEGARVALSTAALETAAVFAVIWSSYSRHYC